MTRGAASHKDRYLGRAILVYLYADVTTVYCIGSTVDEACNLLNNALNELNKWCFTNSLTPHSSKCEVTLIHRGSFTGPLPLITIRNVNVAWVCHTRLLGITIDRNLTWANHLKELMNNVVNKLNLLKECSFLDSPFSDIRHRYVGNCNNLALVVQRLDNSIHPDKSLSSGY